MNVIVTAGPTYEPLDAVRRLTNFSTGQLGTELAEFLAEKNHSVSLLRGVMAAWPPGPKTPPFQTFTTGADLSGQFERLAARDFDAVFHAAAVCDFAFGEIQPGEGNRSLGSGKIPSQKGRRFIELIPTPRILARLRGLFPQAVLIGWKYEVEGDVSRALDRARAQILQNQTDGAVVNGPAYGLGFALVRPDGTAQDCPDRAALFQTLLAWAESRRARRA